MSFSQVVNKWAITREWCGPGVHPVVADREQLCLLWRREELLSDVDFMLDVASAPQEAAAAVLAYQKEGATCVLNVPIKGAAGVVTNRIGVHSHGGQSAGPPRMILA